MEFDSPYSMNVIDICPVGALTSMDFRFNARVWEMSFTNSICPGCSRGCNVKLGVRNNEILRIEPRTNMHVNEYWMCDAGRLEQYSYVNENRISEPHLKGKHTDWESAIIAVNEVLQAYNSNQIMIIGSAYGTNEDIYATIRFAKEIAKTSHIDFLEHRDPAFSDEMLKLTDRTPNHNGAIALGLFTNQHESQAEIIAQKIAKHSIKVIIAIGENIASHPAFSNILGNVEHIISLASNDNETNKIASIVLPSSTYAEVYGTFTNAAQRVQLLEPAIATKENERFMGLKMSRWDKLGAYNDRWSQGEKRNSRPVWSILSAIALQYGHNWNYTSAEDVFESIISSYSLFHGMSYVLLEEYQGLVLGNAKNPEAKKVAYESHLLKPQI